MFVFACKFTIAATEYELARPCRISNQRAFPLRCMWRAGRQQQCEFIFCILFMRVFFWVFNFNINCENQQCNARAIICLMLQGRLAHAACPGKCCCIFNQVIDFNLALSALECATHLMACCKWRVTLQIAARICLPLLN